MAYLLDTNILFRYINAADPQHGVVLNALALLQHRRQTLYLTAQNLIEFRNGATRPAIKNGLGLSPQIVDREIAKLEHMFPMLVETPLIYPAWKSLASSANIIGKNVHDTRLVAVCHVYGISHLLTFNIQDFTRFQSIGPGIIIVDPAHV